PLLESSTGPQGNARVRWGGRRLARRWRGGRYRAAFAALPLRWRFFLVTDASADPGLKTDPRWTAPSTVATTQSFIDCPQLDTSRSLLDGPALAAARATARCISGSIRPLNRPE